VWERTLADDSLVYDVEDGTAPNQICETFTDKDDAVAYKAELVRLRKKRQPRPTKAQWLSSAPAGADAPATKEKKRRQEEHDFQAAHREGRRHARCREQERRQHDRSDERQHP